MISQYNLTRAEERKSKLLSQSGPMPMGDLFENRPNPPDKRLINERNASAVIEQVERENIWVCAGQGKRVLANSNFICTFI